jgi:hypothetical protein
MLVYTSVTEIDSQFNKQTLQHYKFVGLNTYKFVLIFVYLKHSG